MGESYSVEYSTVDTGASLTNLDPFISARYAAEAAESKLTHWVVRPAVGAMIRTCG
jgi:hypothetical protein